MSTQEVSFYSRGVRLAATLRLPDRAALNAPVGVVVQGPGWLGLRDAKLYGRYHTAMLDAGLAVMTFDYHGFGDSEGDATYLDPMAQVQDWGNAVTYAQTRQEIDPGRIGAFGSGGTGGGHAIVIAALDDRVRAVVSQVPSADGRDWLKRMRREHEWLAFLESLREDRTTRVVLGRSALVSPRDGLMVPTPERATTNVKSDVDGRVPVEVQLASAEAIFAYRPIDLVGQIGPRALMLICVENDATTPEDHAYRLFEKANQPKRLVVQTGTTHYGAYAQYGDVVTPMIVDWFCRYLPAAATSASPVDGSDDIVRLTPPG
jgi:hypothetical protein